MNNLGGLVVVICSLYLGAVDANQSKIDMWETLLKPKYFPDTVFNEAGSVIELHP